MLLRDIYFFWEEFHQKESNFEFQASKQAGHEGWLVFLLQFCGITSLDRTLPLHFFVMEDERKKATPSRGEGCLRGAQVPFLSPPSLSLSWPIKQATPHLSCQLSLQRGFVCWSPRQRLRKSKICYFSI